MNSSVIVLLVMLVIVVALYQYRIHTLKNYSEKLKLEVETLRTEWKLPVTGKHIVLSEDNVTSTLKTFINDADIDELIALSNLCFGGKMKYEDQMYVLYPNVDYQGGYDYLSWSNLFQLKN